RIGKAARCRRMEVGRRSLAVQRPRSVDGGRRLGTRRLNGVLHDSGSCKILEGRARRRAPDWKRDAAPLLEERGDGALIDLGIGASGTLDGRGDRLRGFFREISIVFLERLVNLEVELAV